MLRKRNCANLGIAVILAFCICFMCPETQASGERHQQNVTCVLDAGHGGEDGGAVAADGTEEAQLNLSIVLHMRDILGLFGIAPLLTRTEAEIPYPSDAKTLREKKVWDQQNRLSLVESTSNAVFLSIHQNYYGNPQIHGAQALWAPTEGSQALAVLLQSLMQTELDASNTRQASLISEEIWLMNNVTCPAVLMECGFISNAEELSRLCDPQYQQKLSAILSAGLLIWAETYATYGGIFNGENSVLLHGLR